MTTPSDRPSLKVFLSHRYRSHAVNQQIFGLLDEVADIQFEVDRGIHATSTTRLERLIRDVDAFVGIYSVSDDPFQSPHGTDLRHASRYFQLELDMAVRARKPGIILVDHRFGQVIPAPPGVESRRFRVQEILSPGGEARRRQLRDDFRSFSRSIVGRPPQTAREAKVGLLMDPSSPALAAATAAVAAFDYGFELLPWPVRIDAALILPLHRCDWVLADMSDPSAAAAVAFLRGSGVPVLRIGPDGTDGPDDDLLYGGLAPHYTKDLIRWSDPGRLHDALVERIQVILNEPQLIDGPSGARDYFQSAAKLNHLVFLSYSQKDSAYADQIGAELRGAFQEVFDYRQQEALRHGGHWLDEVLATLANTAVGVPLLSPNYTDSEHCMEEGRRMVDLLLRKRMKVFPVLLDGRAPDLFSQLEYRRISRSSPADIVAGMVRELS